MTETMELRFRAVIFDLDGVLVDTEPIHQRTWIESLAGLGVEVTDEQGRSFQGLRAEQIIELLREDLGDRADSIDLEALIQEKREQFLEIIKHGLPEVPGAERILRGLKGRVPIALVTSARLKSVGQVLLAMNWRNIFEVLVAADHVVNSKPDPEPYARAIARCKIPAAECLVFEDSRVGIASARAAGCRVCGVATSLSSDELRAAGARWTIRDFNDTEALAEALAARGGRGVLGRLRGLFQS